MEFFKKAHVTKPGIKNKKHHEIRKKQFKKMLHGYKNSNTTLIKNAEFIESFDDLDITESSQFDTSIIQEIQESDSTNNSLMDLKVSPNDTKSDSIVSNLKTNYDSKPSTKNEFNAKKLVHEGTGPHGPLVKQIIIENAKKKKYKKELKTEEEDKGNDLSIESIGGEKSLEMFYYKNITDLPYETRSSSPYVSIETNNMIKSSLSDVFEDYPKMDSEAHSLRPISSINFNFSLNVGNTCEIFTNTKLNRNNVKCTEVENREVNTNHNTVDNELMEAKKARNPNFNIEFNEVPTIDVDDKSIYEDISQYSQSNEIETIIPFPYKVYNVQEGCIIVLRHPAEVFLHGEIKIQALGGMTEILGYRLIPSSTCEVYAPSSSYAHILKTVEHPNNYYGLFGKLTGLGLSVADAEDIVTTHNKFDGVLFFKKLYSKKLDFVNNNFRKCLFYKITTAKDVSGCYVYSEIPKKCFYENPMWADISNYNAGNANRGIICGGKGAGKSTFLKYYVNRQLSYGPILVIDLDPGQCEFTVAGNISAIIVKEPIIGPNFTHLRTPVRMLNIGMINVMDNLKKYIAAVSDLLSYCKENEAFKELPWIINTMGMCNAVGLKLMIYIILSLKPTFLVQIDMDVLKKRFDHHLNSETVRSLYSSQCETDTLFRNIEVDYFDYKFFICNQHTETTELKSSISPKDERYLNFLSYFGDLLEINKCTSLLDITPYVVPLNSLYIGSNVEIGEELIGKAINGKIVALCQHQPLNINNKKVFTLYDQPFACLGHGLVRGVDTENGLLYMISPIAQQKLVKVNYAVYSDWAPDISSDEHTLSPNTLVPYRAPPLHSQPELMRAPRRRFNPLQLLRMTKSS